MNTTLIIRAAERMNTLCIRAAYSDEPDARRGRLVEEFNRLTEDMGKMTSPFSRPAWSEVVGQTSLLLVEAVRADEATIGAMIPAGHVAVLATRLVLLADAFGMTLADAATAPAEADDEAAAAAVEMRPAAE